jgi:hypothetical protein
MAITINGTTGIAGVDGSAGTPAVQGADPNTGIFYPAADTIAFAEGGAEVARFDSSGRLGIGTTSPSCNVDVVTSTDSGSTFPRINISNSLVTQGNGTTTWNFARIDIRSGNGTVISDFGTRYDSYAGGYLGTETNHPIFFQTNGTERMRIDSSGNLLVGTTGYFGGTARLSITATAAAQNVLQTRPTTNITYYPSIFENSSGTTVGYIQSTASATSYVTSSDYRLKEAIAPMAGALAKVALLNPVTYKWKSTGEATQGFIAHELQAVVPECVTGEKDAVDADGNPVYQGVDTSFLVATLTAAIQELKAELDTTKARLAALEAK